ncbi:MAG: hypothetical protein JRH19_08630 [Deltaproteobacteria bacterium]|nr:hypothetical protein [Deltaproteobacteria bacterium]
MNGAETRATGIRGIALKLGDYLDVKSGLAGGVLLASIVFCINYSHGLEGASSAAAKQFVYTFFMGATIMRICTSLSLRPGSDLPVLLVAILVPTAVTVGATFLVHSLRGTPEPILSTIPVALISPPSFTFWARRTRSAGCSPWGQLGSRV